MTTTTANSGDTRHWAWPWLMGASLGMSAVGGYYLLVYFKGWRWGWELAGSLWLTVFGGYPFLYHTLNGLPKLLGAFARGWKEGGAPPEVGPAPKPAEAGRSVSPLVGGGLLSAWEQYHYDGLLTLLDHAEAADSLTSTALIPAAFVDGKQWGYWTGILAASHICNKANGVATTLPQGRTWAWAKRQVRNGLFETPEDLGAPPPALPHPFRPGLEYGGKKIIDEDD